jgi:predicted nuclease of predicted toxin-antitoxin system
LTLCNANRFDLVILKTENLTPEQLGRVWIRDLQALSEFLAATPEWAVHERRTNNNGLTVLKRVQLP